MNDLIYQLALALVPNIGDVHAKILLEHFGDAASIFKAPLSTLEKIEGIGIVRARSIKYFRDFRTAEQELAFTRKFGIRILTRTDPEYPQRLLHCYDAPPLLFYKGQSALNTTRVLGIVGTRNHTEYGKLFTEKLVKELSSQPVTIISGLAYGIDAVAHKSALKHNLPTLAVVAHGLDKIYPAEHAQLAKDMIRRDGGMLTEFFSGTAPDKHNFPLRNRIVAGLCDAVVVIETDLRGGSMITAKLADGYNRDVFALPGRTTDRRSSGCNHLIRHNRAILLNGATDLLEIMGWCERKGNALKKQRELFIELTADEKRIIQLLQEKEVVSIDEINLRSGLTSSGAAAAILNLELQSVIATLPGKMYKLV